MSEGERDSRLHLWILLGLILGASAGLLANEFLDPEWVRDLNRNVMRPIGNVFLRMLLMTVVPLVFCSLAVGVAQLGDLNKLGRMGARTFAYFAVTMTLATVIGLTLVNLLRPGDSFTLEEKHRLRTQYQGKDQPQQREPFGVETFVKIVPSNPIEAAAKMDMLAVIFFALLVGAGLTKIEPDRADLLVRALEGFGKVMVFIIGLAMRIAPVGVFAFLFAVTSEFGMGVLESLGKYMMVVILGLAIQMFVVLSILLKVLSRVSPREFFKRVRTILVTAFSTSSSNATLPTSIKVTQEELGVPSEVAGFVLPLGATMNMNGTALFEGVTVVFLAQVFLDAPLALGEQIVVVVLAVLTAIGAAGVPGGSLPLLMMILAFVGVPPAGIAIILGVDRLLDMCRTTLNVIGDVSAATYVARSEGYPLMGEPAVAR